MWTVIVELFSKGLAILYLPGAHDTKRYMPGAGARHPLWYRLSNEALAYLDR